MRSSAPAGCILRFLSTYSPDLQLVCLSSEYNLLSRTCPTNILRSFSHSAPTGLSEAYATPYIGNTAQDFIDYLCQRDEEVLKGELILYAKVVSVVQSSGTGKSRMLTEVR
jgi:hypothetical protein